MSRKVNGVSEMLAALILISITLAGFGLVAATVAPHFANQGASVIELIHKNQVALGQMATVLYSTEQNGIVYSYIYNFGTTPITPQLIAVTMPAYGANTLIYYSLGGWTVYAWEANNNNFPYSTTPTTYGTVFAQGTFPTFYFSYGTPIYQGQTHLGMNTIPFPSSLNGLNSQSQPPWVGYTAYSTFTIDKSGMYWFNIVTDDEMAVYINGPGTNGWESVFGNSAWHFQGATNYQQNEWLQAGTYQIAIMWDNGGGGPGMSAFLITSDAGNNNQSLNILTASLTFLNGTPTQTIPPHTVVRLTLSLPQSENVKINMLTTAGQMYEWNVTA